MALSDDLVSYYKADTSGSFPDAKASNDGTITGATYDASGKLGGCYSFSSSNDHIDLWDWAMGDDFSISFWYKTGGLATNDRFFSKGGQSSGGNANGYDMMLFHSSANQLDFRMGFAEGGYSRYYGGTTVETDTWTHCVITCSSLDTVKIYQNGTEIGGTDASSGTRTTRRNTVNEIWLGGDGYSAYSALSFDGELDEIGFWDKELTSTEVSELYNSGDGLAYPFSTATREITKINGVSLEEGGTIIGHATLATDLETYWEFDDLTDATGNGYDLTNVGATSSATGIIGDCYDFDGSNDYMVDNTVATDIINAAGSQSMSFWCYQDVDETNTMPWSVYNNSNSRGAFVFRHADNASNEARMYTNLGGTADTTFNSDSALPTEEWVHIVFTWDTTTSKMYVNGTLQTDTGSQWFPSQGIDEFRIGMHLHSGSLHFDGKIDEFGIWGKALTASEVTDLYNGGEGLPYD